MQACLVPGRTFEPVLDQTRHRGKWFPCARATVPLEYTLARQLRTLSTGLSCQDNDRLPDREPRLLMAVCRPTGSGRVGGIAALYARAMSSGSATKADRSRRFGHIRKPDFSGAWHPASREIKQDRRST